MYQHVSTFTILNRICVYIAKRLVGHIDGSLATVD